MNYRVNEGVYFDYHCVGVQAMVTTGTSKPKLFLQSSLLSQRSNVLTYKLAFETSHIYTQHNVLRFHIIANYLTLLSVCQK